MIAGLKLPGLKVQKSSLRVPYRQGGRAGTGELEPDARLIPEGIGKILFQDQTGHPIGSRLHL